MPYCTGERQEVLMHTPARRRIAVEAHRAVRSSRQPRRRLTRQRAVVAAVLVAALLVRAPAGASAATAAPFLQLVPSVGKSGTPVNVWGTGFSAGETVKATYATGLNSPKSMVI